VSAIYPQNGQYLENGERLATLVPNEARPWMIATVTPKQAARLKIGGYVKLNVAGLDAEYTGKIKEIQSGMKDSTPVLEALGPNRPVKVKIELDQKLPVDFINRPAQASFSLH
jgi:multidrug resistance efflux pump